jgi:2-polyprenyl-6-hydroxyphenyl methylase/3-demethylubiquinone-9 3-methyltransferase
VGAEYVLAMLPKGTHDYRKFLAPSTLAGMARKAGLELEDLIGLNYNPLTRAYKLGPDCSVNYLVAMTRAEAPPRA